MPSPSSPGSNTSTLMDPGSRFEVQIFRKYAQSLYAVRQQQWKSEDGSLKPTTTEPEMRQLGWLHLAAFWNPVAALQFRKVAQIVENLFVLHSPTHLWVEASESRDRRLWCNDPISYLEGVQFEIPRLLTQLLQDWRQSLRGETDNIPDLRRYEFTFETIHGIHSSLLQIAVVDLWEFLQEKHFVNDGDATLIGVDPFSGLAAIDHIFNEVSRILGEMEALLKENAGSVPTDENVDR